MKIRTVASSQSLKEAWFLESLSSKKMSSRVLDENFVRLSGLLNGFLLITLHLLMTATVTYRLDKK